MTLNLKKTIAFFDLETTGIDFSKDRIIEISILRVEVNGDKKSRTWRVNPGIPIPAEASIIHGIYDADVKDSPLFTQVAHDIDRFLEGCDLAGYNSNRFDIPMLVEECLRAGIDLRVERRKLVDVQKIFHLMEKRTLGAAYTFYCDKVLENAHSAEADTNATFEILCAQLQRYKNDITNDVHFLHDFTKEGEFVDVARRMIMDKGKEVFNFGKHKGRPVIEVLKEEPQYYDWIMKNDFPLHTKRKLTEIKLRMSAQLFKV